MEDVLRRSVERGVTLEQQAVETQDLARVGLVAFLFAVFLVGEDRALRRGRNERGVGARSDDDEIHALGRRVSFDTVGAAEPRLRAATRTFGPDRRPRRDALVIPA